MLSRSATAVSSELILRLAQARDETDRVFATIQPSFLYERPIRERHRIVFYVGHLEAFDWNLLRAHLDIGTFNPMLDQLFAFGIDPIAGSGPSDQPGDWPTLGQVNSYRQRTRAELDTALAEATDSEDLVQLLNIAIEHRLMHAETLEYMFHQLPYEAKVIPAELAIEIARAKPVASEEVRVPAGQVRLGLARYASEFGWDNEFEAHTVDVPEFCIDRYKVTNGQFLEFLHSGGYTNPSFWTEADWKWRSEAAISHPVFWKPGESGFRYRSMFEEQNMPMDAPVYVSQAEASAFARWAGKHLPTEAEWQRAAEGAEGEAQGRVLWDPPAISKPMGRHSVFGVEGLYGTGWEWTSTPFGPFPGFRPHPAYSGYSANFFDNQHYVMKGGSPRTDACMLRKTFRNWFQAHYQYAYAGFRCVSNNEPRRLEIE